MAERKYKNVAERQRAYRARKDAREAGRLAMLEELWAMLVQDPVSEGLTVDSIRWMLAKWRIREREL